MTAPGGVDFSGKDTGLRLAQTILLDSLRGTHPSNAAATCFTIGVHLGMLVDGPERAEWLAWFDSWAPPGATFARLMAAMNATPEP